MHAGLLSHRLFTDWYRSCGCFSVLCSCLVVQFLHILLVSCGLHMCVGVMLFSSWSGDGLSVDGKSIEPCGPCHSLPALLILSMAIVGLATDNQWVFVTDFEHHRICVFDLKVHAHLLESDSLPS